MGGTPTQPTSFLEGCQWEDSSPSMTNIGSAQLGSDASEDTKHTLPLGDPGSGVSTNADSETRQLLQEIVTPMLHDGVHNQNVHSEMQTQLFQNLATFSEVNAKAALLDNIVTEAASF